MSARRPRLGQVATVLLGVTLVVAAVVVAVAAGRDNGTRAVTVAAGGTRTVAVRLADMRINPSRITVPSGIHLVLQVTNADDLPHDLNIDGGPQTPLLSQGESARLDLGAITHDRHGWCTVPGHRAAGMTMTIIATGGPATMPGMAAAPNPSGGTTGGTTGGTARINPNAVPGPDWRPYNPALQPVIGSTVHRVRFTVHDARTEVAPGVWQTLWTYNGTAPGPILHGQVGDLFIVTIVNATGMAHSIDFHAGSVDPDGPMRSIAPGKSLRYEFRATYSGAWLYHCSTMPMSQHIANGMYGAVIIDPPDLDPVARQFVLVQSELYLGPQNGIADEAKVAAREPDAVVFNGYVDQYEHAPIRVPTNQRIRVWVVDAGPEFGTSFHVVGTRFDTVFKEGGYLIRANNPEHGAAQSLDLAAGQGGFVEFSLPAPGHYPFVDHAMVEAEHGAAGVFLAR